MTGLEPHPVPGDVDPDEWALQIEGTVAQPLCLDWNDLGSYPKESFTADFACVEGWTAEDLSWRGIRVGTFLDRADPTPASTHVLVHAMDDDYACAFPIDRVRDAVLALELGGEPLAVDHGGPARLVPTDSGSDCWESVKWVSEFEVRESEPRADDTAKVIALSRIE